MVPTFSDSARFGSCCAYLLKFLVNGAGSDGRCNTFSNRLVQWDFSRSNHLRVLFFVDLSSEDEVRRLKLLHLDTELVLHRPIESTRLIRNYANQNRKLQATEMDANVQSLRPPHDLFLMIYLMHPSGGVDCPMKSALNQKEIWPYAVQSGMNLIPVKFSIENERIRPGPGVTKNAVRCA